MEGVTWNYEDKWCLDSQVIFDELGLNYGPGIQRAEWELED